MTFTERETINRNNIIEQINKVAQPFEDVNKILSTIDTEDDIVLLGECTHGTEEFYKIRADITKALVTKSGFRVIFIEAEWPDIYLINEYIHGKYPGMEVEQALSKIKNFPLWMWRNKVFIELIEWLHEYNREHIDNKVYILGIDCQQFLRTQKQVLDILHKIDVSFYNKVKVTTSLLCNFVTENQYAANAVYGELKRNVGIMVYKLQELLSVFQWDKYDNYIKRPDIAAIDIITCEQSFEILVNAEEYFRKMLEEPPGSQASWNTRDQHMLMSIMRMRNRWCDIVKIKDATPKIIIWAHNSHIGDSTATNRGCSGFEHNNTWNVGQMVRQMFPNTKTIGFYTYSGTVRAAEKSGREGVIQVLNKAISYSYEWFFHEVSAKYDKRNFCIYLNKLEKIDKTNRTLEEVVTRPIPGDYRDVYTGNTIHAVNRTIDKNGVTYLVTAEGQKCVEFVLHGSIQQKYILVDTLYNEPVQHFLSGNMLQRWVGVHYVKDTELESHYGESSLIHQYDTVVFIDNTVALKI